MTELTSLSQKSRCSKYQGWVPAVNFQIFNFQSNFQTLFTLLCHLLATHLNFYFATFIRQFCLIRRLYGILFGQKIAYRTACCTQYDWLLAWHCCLSVCQSVMMCIVALRVSVGVESCTVVFVDFLFTSSCRIYHLATNSKKANQKQKQTSVIYNDR